ncbi:hypothetical protein G5714_010260 [Onychostoma macrolepis]|uniref:Uncharacterized protein n=1 Tax=Onychostoma macrolepis TaxID=369639 RepID=A0A7J6CPE8_9TELE|nr:hypothetical protein G5714_010260 [Onychostoma macrolepis]
MFDQESEEEQLFSRNVGEDYDLDDAAVSVCRSSCLANKTPAPLNTDWPTEKILTTLHSQNIQAYLWINHKELFKFLLENISKIPPNPSTSTPSGGRKVTAKRKHSSRSANAPVPKSRSTERSDISQVQLAEDPVMTVLQSIQRSLSNLDARVQTLENQPSSSIATATIPSPIPAPTAPDIAVLSSSAAFGIAGLLPRRSLATAIPAPITGAPFFPPAAAISPQLQAQIIAEMSSAKLNQIIGPNWTPVLP